jgi:Mce-associated membrane protein
VTLDVAGTASWAARAGAFTIDVIFGLGVVATALLVCLSAPPQGWLWWLTLVIGGAALMAVLVNRLLLPAATGWSFGRSVFGIAVISQAGDAVSPWRLLLRDMAHVLDTAPLFLGWLWPLVDSRGRTFADFLVRTEVHLIEGDRPDWRTRVFTAIAAAAGMRLGARPPPRRSRLLPRPKPRRLRSRLPRQWPARREAGQASGSARSALQYLTSDAS